MRIRLAILEEDANYLNRIVSVFSTKYADKFEIHSFTNYEVALSYLENSKMDVFISDDSFEVDIDKLPKKCGFAYFVESSDIDTCNGQKAIGKFQKVDLIYKQILSIYSENSGNVSGLKLGDDRTRIIAFSSVGGGAGTSSMAAACAKCFASQNKKTIYINLEEYGISDTFFSGEGQFDMSDIIFALKSKKTNLPLKLESCVKQDPSGVYFYSKPKVALDMMELGAEEVVRFISELKLNGSYDYIILDMAFALDKGTRSILQEVHSIVWVSDGSETNNTKIFRAYQAVAVLEQNSDVQISGKLFLLYNKFSNKTGRPVQDIDIPMLGGAPRYEHASAAQVIEQLVSKVAFAKIG